MKRVLLIDDEDDIREVAAMALETVAGWTVLAANGGRSGAELAAKERPDAVLLDVMMPDVDGPGTLALLQQQDATRNIPVVFLTAKTQSAEQQRLRQLGVAGIIQKPFDPLALASDISKLLGWQE